MTLGPATCQGCKFGVDVQGLSWAVGEGLLLSHVHCKIALQDETARTGSLGRALQGEWHFCGSRTSGGPQRGRIQDPQTWRYQLHKIIRKKEIPTFCRATGRVLGAGSSS